MDAAIIPVDSFVVTDLDTLLNDENLRRAAFPACRDRLFFAHAAVAPIPQVAVEAMDEFNRASATGELDYGEVFLRRMDRVRGAAARLFGGDADEFALLGPTSLGLSLVAVIADLHGAELTLADNGPGLRVTLRFPPPRSARSSAPSDRST